MQSLRINLCSSRIASLRTRPACAPKTRSTSRLCVAAMQPAERLKAAVVGAFTADAACTGIHWVYRQADVLALAQGKPKLPALEGGFAALGAENKAPWEGGNALPPLVLSDLRPEFLQPNANPFYDYPCGQQSPYGHEALLLLRSLVREGSLDEQAFARDSFAALSAYPGEGGRLNGLSKSFITAYEGGARPPTCGDAANKEAHSLVRTPALLARFGASPEGLAKLEAAIRVHQSNSLALAYARAFALILQRVAETDESIPAALAWAAEAKEVPEEARPCITAALASTGKDVRAVGNEHGLGCTMPASFIVALAVAAQYGDDYVAANRANMMVGGDSASRSAVVGALAAARAGSVPAAWVDKVTLRAEIDSGAAALLQKR
jgi:ADP-ribosylglycohydrolase